MAKVEMKGPAGLVPVDEKDVRAYKARGYTVLGEHAPAEETRADCDKIEKPAVAPAPAPEPAPDPPELEFNVAESDPVEPEDTDEDSKLADAADAEE